MTEIAAPEAPADHYYATVKGRSVLVKNINPAQQMVLGGLLRSLNSTDVESNLAALGKLAVLFEALIVDSTDRDWLEEGIMNGSVELADFAGIFVLNSAPQRVVAAAPKKPRRGR